MADQELTYGQKAVGLSFDPSGNTNVQRVKELYAEIIDLCELGRQQAFSAHDDTQAVLFSIAITTAQAALKRAEKAITWEG